MKVTALAIPDIKLIVPDVYKDSRGEFSETYSWRSYKDAGIDADFVQDNQSLSKNKGTVRGMHFQAPPFAQGKLVRVLQGKVLDVAVDVRAGSPYFGQSVSAVLDAEKGTQMWVPQGFLHGFLTLADDTKVAYKVTNYYDKASEGSIRWDDADLGINWGTDMGHITVSDRDSQAMRFADFKSPFRYSEI